MTETILGVATLVLLALSLLPISRNPAWWVRAPEFPRLQLLFLAFVLVALQWVLVDISRPVNMLVLTVGILILLYHAWRIAPYTPLFPSEVGQATASKRERQIRILTANVLMTNRNADGLLNLVYANSPDVLITLESDAWWESQLAALLPGYPHTILCPLDNTYGMHLYSKFPLKDSDIEYLVEDDVPSFHTRIELPCGVAVQTHVLHPAPPAPLENDGSTERDAELLIIARRLTSIQGPVIVTGDLNDVAWSRTTKLFRKISGLLDPRIGRGLFNTFNAFHWYMRWPLDHLFHSAHFRLSEIRRLDKFGSDHFPLLTALQFQPALKGTQSPIEAVPGDRQKAHQLIRRAGEAGNLPATNHE